MPKDPLKGWFCTFCGKPKSEASHLITSPALVIGDGRLVPEDRPLRAQIGICPLCVDLLRKEISQSGVRDGHFYCHICTKAAGPEFPLSSGPMARLCMDCIDACSEFFSQLKAEKKV